VKVKLALRSPHGGVDDVEYDVESCGVEGSFLVLTFKLEALAFHPAGPDQLFQKVYPVSRVHFVEVLT
jgi:hypothetical protein